MRGLLAVASRELVERRNAFVAAAVTAGLPFLAPLAPWLGGNDPAELRAVVALTLASAFAAALAMGYGAATISGELKERRLGFFFARPLSGLAIWGGKLLAGVVLVWVAPAIVLVPTWMASPSSGPWQSADDTLFLGLIAAAAVLLLAVAHAVGIALRARSPWLIVDVVMIVVVVLLVRSSALRLLDEGATDAWKWTFTGLLIAVPLAVIVAGAVQVIHGRTDLRRGHRALSLTLWSSLLAVSLVGQAFSWWVVHPTIADLRGVGLVEAAPQGSWVALEAAAPGRGDYRPAFLVDVDSRRSLGLGGLGRWELPLAFSADGRRAVCLRRDDLRGRTGRSTLMTIDLGEGHPVPRSTLISFPSWVFRLELSPDGRRVAALHETTLSVAEVDSGALVASVRTHPGPIHFVAHDTIRLYRFQAAARGATSGAIVISELDLATRAFRETGRIEAAGRTDGAFLRRDPASDRLLHVPPRPRPGTPTLRDARTGAILADLSAADAGWSASATFLSGGGIAVAEAREGRARLRVLSWSGAPGWSLDLGAGHRARVAGETAPGALLVVVSSDETWSPSSARTVVVDLATRSAKVLSAGLVPLGWTGLFAAAAGPEPGSPAVRVFVTSDDGLVLRDPTTGATRALVAGRRPSEE